GTRPIGHAAVEGNPDQADLDPGPILGIGRAHERRQAGIAGPVHRVGHFRITQHIPLPPVHYGSGSPGWARRPMLSYIGTVSGTVGRSKSAKEDMGSTRITDKVHKDKREWKAQLTR